MPLIQGTTADERDFERQNRQPAPEPSPSQQNLAIVERESSNKLPSDLSFLLSQLGLSPREYRQAARWAARLVDVPYSMVPDVSDPWARKYVSTDFTQSVRSAETYQAAIAAKVFSKVIEHDEGASRTHSRGGKELKKLTPGRIAGAIQTLQPLYKYDIKDTRGYALALTVAKNYDLGRFRENLATVEEWARETGRIEEFEMEGLISIAGALTDAGVKVDNPYALVRYLAPALAQEEATEQAAIEAKVGTYDPEHDVIQPEIASMSINKLALLPADDILKFLGVGEEQKGTLAEQIDALEKNVYENSSYFAQLEGTWFERNIAHHVDTFLDETQKLGYRALLEAETPVIAGIGIIQGAIPGGGDSIESQLRETFENRHRAIMRLNLSQRTFGTPSLAWAYGYGDEWWAPGFDFLVAWATDPTVILGKVAKGRYLTRAAPGLMDRPSLVANIAAKGVLKSEDLTSLALRYNDWRWNRFDDVVREFSSSDDVKRIFRSIDDEKAYTARVYGMYSKYEVNGLNPIYMKELRREIIERFPAGTKLGRSKKALEEFRQGILTHFTGWSPDGSAANVAFSRTAQIQDEAERLLLQVEDGSITLDKARSQLQALGPGATDSVALPLKLEVPKRGRPIPGLGSKAAAKARYIERGREQSLARYEFGMNPGRILNVEDRPDLHIRLDGERARLPEEQIVKFENEMAEAAASPVGREDLVFGVTERFREAVFESKLEKALNGASITPDAKAELRRLVFDPFDKANRKRPIFATVPPELDPTIPKNLDDFRPRDRATVAKFIRDQRKSSPSWMHMDPIERRVLDRQLKAWAKGATRPDQETWLRYYEAKHNISEHLRSLADLEDRARSAALHPLLTADERIQEIRDYFAELGLVRQGDGRWRLVRQDPPKWVDNILQASDGEDIDKLIDAVVRYAPEGGMLRQITTKGGRGLPWAKRGFAATLVAELEDALGDDLFKLVVRDADSTRDILGNFRKAMNFSNPLPLHPEDIARRMGVTLDTDDDVLRALGRIDDNGKPVMRAEGRFPLTKGQLRNTIVMPDPLDIEDRIEGFIGAQRRLRQRFAKDVTIDSITRSKLDAALTKTEFGAKDAVRAYRRAWKGWSVARPSYIPRVIFIDEFGRFAFTRGVGEYLMSHRLGPFGRWLDRTGAFDRPVVINGDEVARLRRTGSDSYRYEPLASQRMRQQELVDEAVRDALSPASRLQVTGDFDLLEPGKAGHLSAWVNELTVTMAGTEPGLRVLQGVADGKSVRQIADELEAWGRGPGRQLLESRQGVSGKKVRLWAETFAAAGVHYTMADGDIARAAMTRIDPERLAKYLRKNVKSSEMPVVFGPTGDLVKEGAGTRFLNWMYEWNVRRPEDAFNRQPFLRSQKAAAEGVLWDVVKRSGASVDDTLRRAVDVQSTRYGLDQTRRIMFDPSKQQRILEQMTVAFPFPQPFFEGYTAWGHIAFYRNPTTLPHLRQIFNLGRDTGILYKDENDEWRIKWHPLNWVLHKVGLLPEGVELTMPLQNLSLLQATQLSVGPLDIPLPGADVLVQTAGQNFFRDSTNDAIVSYFFQYGSKTSLIPYPLQSYAELISPGSFTDDNVERMTLWVMRDMQYKGLDVDEDGDPIPYKQIEEQARDTALDLLRARAAAGIIGPTAGTFRWEWQDKLDELRELRDTLGYEDGTQTFNEKYDYRYTLMTVGTTDWMQEFEGRDTPRIPPSEFAAKITSLPLAKDFMRQYPAWFGLLLVGANPEVANEFNSAYYARQYEKGLVRPADPREFWGEGEAAKAWPEWVQWRDAVYNPMWDRWQKEGNGNYESRLYTEMVKARREKLWEMRQKYPLWAKDNLAESYDVNEVTGERVVVGYDWPGGDPDRMPSAVIYAQARAIINEPSLKGIEGVDALRFYLEGGADAKGRRILGVDEIAGRMEDLGISDIRIPSAEEAGLAQKYDRLWKYIEETWPDAHPLIESYFDGDLTSLETETVEAARGPLGPAILRLDTEWRELQGAQQDYEFEHEFFANLQRTQNWENDLWSGEFNKRRPRGEKISRETFEAWFDSAYPPGSPKRQNYVYEQALKEPEFMSAWDLHILGLDVTPKAAQYISAIGDARQKIAAAKREALLDGETFEAGPMYDAINKQVKDWMNPKSEDYDATFAKWVESSNRWGWGVKAAGLTQQPGQLGDAWRDIYDVLGQVQTWADDRGLLGTEYGAAEDKRDYALVQEQLMDAIKDEYFGNKAFKAQWMDLKKTNQGSLIETLMPSAYFKLGE